MQNSLIGSKCQKYQVIQCSTWNHSNIQFTTDVNKFLETMSTTFLRPIGMPSKSGLMWPSLTATLLCCLWPCRPQTEHKWLNLQKLVYRSKLRLRKNNQKCPLLLLKIKLRNCYKKPLKFCCLTLRVTLHKNCTSDKSFQNWNGIYFKNRNELYFHVGYTK